MNRTWTASLAVILLFLSFWGPIELINTKLFDLKEKETLWTEALQKEELIQGMIHFQNDLNPEKYLENAVLEIEKKFISQLSSSELSFAGDDFPAFVQKSLQDDFGINPLFVCSIGADPYAQSSILSQKLHLSENEVATFTDFIIRFSVSDLYRHLTGAVGERMKNFFENHVLQRRGENFERSTASFQFSFKKFLGAYYSSTPLPDRVTKFFLDRQGFQFLFYYSRPLVFNQKFLGMLTVGVLENDLNVKRLIHFAEVRNKIESRQINRRVFHSSNKLKSGFNRDQSGVSLIDAIPSELKALLNTQHRLGAKGRVSASKSLWLKLTAVDAANESGQFVSKLPGFSIRLLILFLSALWLKNILFGFRVPLNLRRKFVVLLAIVLIPPTIVISFFSSLISSRAFAVQTALGRSRLISKLDTMESIFNEGKTRQIFHNMGVKKLLSDLLQNTLLENFNFEGLRNFLKISIEDTLILDKNGRSITISKIFLPDDSDPIELNNCVKYLNSLGVLDKSIPEAAKALEKALFTDGFMEGLFSLLEESEIMGEEGLQTARLTKPSSIELSQYFLLPDLTSSPIKPLAICLLGTKLKEPAFKLMKNYKGFHRFFYEAVPDYEVSLAVAERNSGSYKNTHILSNADYAKAFRDIFLLAVERGASGDSFENTAKGVVINFWRFYPTSPIMIAGRCLIKENSQTKFFFGFLPFAMVGFSLLALILLSELMNSLFLLPIRALSDGVDRVAHDQNFQVKVKIDNNDEFDEMGQAFNKMTLGLLQRSHLSRFVSNRLVSSLSNSTAEISELGEEMEVTVLCSDLRGFTTISENNSPQEVVEFLNEYFTEMEAAIESHGGVIDKFIGDAIIAVFYLDENSESVKNACMAAMDMRRALGELNESRSAMGLFNIENGVGIATGKAISGNIGVPGSRMDYTITGKIVNLANDLEAISKFSTSSKIIVDKETQDRLAKILSFQTLEVGEKTYFELKSLEEKAS